MSIHSWTECAWWTPPSPIRTLPPPTRWYHLNFSHSARFSSDGKPTPFVLTADERTRTAESPDRPAPHRDLLHRALIELMIERVHQRLTVTGVIDRADAGRSTF
ncbi:hypothetical protein [Nocardia cyriacigeorgica]|nr:hypothetical protein [Nocardia cyriacigeorgica]